MKSFCLRFPEGKAKAMTFSYDDGPKHDYQLIELMRKYGIKGTFNLNSFNHKNDPENRISKDFICQLAKDPQFEVACHGHQHPYYTFLPSSVAIDDIMIDRKFFEELTGEIIRGFAYPYGPSNETAVAALKTAGIVYGRTTKSTSDFDLPENWLQWHPTCHHKNSLEIYDKFEAINRSAGNPCVMYVWGHSYEFGPGYADSFEVIETLFERCHKNTDIWFATNMEIYEYVEGFRRLVFSADGSMVHNPSCFDMWALLDGYRKPDTGKTVKIPAGETIKLY